MEAFGGRNPRRTRYVEGQMKRWDLINQDSGEKTWLTPLRIIRALGHFDTDPCCPPNMPWRTADRMLTKEQDGRTAEWMGRVWLNPPYGRDSLPFMCRMSTYDGGGGVSLLFTRTDTEVWHKWIFPYAHAVMFLRGRIHFCSLDGTEKEPAPCGSALIAWSQFDTQALESSGLNGTIVRLK